MPSEGAVATLKLEDPLIKLEGPTSVVGRAVVVHIAEGNYLFYNSVLCRLRFFAL